jgi:hypothetical protein
MVVCFKHNIFQLPMVVVDWQRQLPRPAQQRVREMDMTSSQNKQP